MSDVVAGDLVLVSRSGVPPGGSRCVCRPLRSSLSLAVRGFLAEIMCHELGV